MRNVFFLFLLLFPQLLISQKKELQDTLLHNFSLFEDNLFKGFDYALKNMEMAEKSGDPKKIAYARLYLGLSYAWEKNYKFAIEEYTGALAGFEKINDTAGEIKCYFLMGVSIANNEPCDFKRSNELHLKAIRLCRNFGDSLFPAYSYHELSANYATMNQDSLAEQYAKKALETIKRSSDYGAIINGYHWLGWIYMSKHMADQALPYTIEGLTIAKQHHSISQLAQLYNDLSIIYAQKNDFSKAYLYERNYTEVTDSLNSTTYNEQMHEMAAKYQNEEQQRKIEEEQFLRNSIISGTAALTLFFIIGFILYKRRRDALQKQSEAEQNLYISETEMKALRAQMNPHFIFNSLNSIYNFVKSNDPVKAGEYISKFSKLMRLILENSRQKEVPLSEDLETLKLYMELESLRLKNKFSFDIEMDKSIDPEGVYIPPMMMQPFLENSIWHGFDDKKGKGVIHLRVSRRSEYLVCEVEDNGTGRGVSNLNGFDNAMGKNQSLATTITLERINILNQVNKIKSSLQIIDLEQGVKVVLFFPYIAEY